jgi:hypothetical protein
LAAKKRQAKPRKKSDTVGKRLQFDRDTWNAINLLARDQMKDVGEITEEALRDLLMKYGRSADTREALKLSVKAVDKDKKKRR